MADRVIELGDIPITTCGVTITKEPQKTETGEQLYSMTTGGLYSADQIKVIGKALSEFTDRMFDEKTKPISNTFQMFAYRPR